MIFENCKQIEINGRVFDVWRHHEGRNGSLSIIDKGFEHTFTYSMLEAIGAKPVVEMPKDGDKVVVWNSPKNKFIRVTNGKTESGCLGTYSEYSDGRLFFGTWENWKPFNPEELE
jgi:hypothetical protein